MALNFSKNRSIKMPSKKNFFKSETPQGVSFGQNLKNLLLAEFGNFQKFFPSRFLKILFNRSFDKLTLEIQKDAEFSQLQNASIESSLRAKIAFLGVFQWKQVVEIFVFQWLQASGRGGNLKTSKFSKIIIMA